MKNNKLLVAAGATVLLLAGGTAAFLVGQDKPGANNQDVNIVEASKVKVKETVEYGANIDNEKVVINTKDGKQEYTFKDLNLSVDTMKLGKQDYKVTQDKKIVEIEVTVKDTKKPIIEGVQEKVSLKSDVDMEKQLAKVITAKDPVDGELEVKFDMKQKTNKNEYDVTARAEDKNGNKTSSQFLVLIEKSMSSTENKNSTGESNKVASDVNSGSVSKPSNETNAGVTTTPKTPNQSKPVEPKPQPKPETKPVQKPAEPTETKPVESKPQPKPEQQAKPEIKPETKPTPKPETKPTPKPETKPTPKPPSTNKDGEPKITITGSVPGAEKVSQSHGKIIYSFNKSLPGGGKITSVRMLGSRSGNFAVALEGKDKNGGMIVGMRNKGDSKTQYSFTSPALTPEAFAQIEEWATMFLNAHEK